MTDTGRAFSTRIEGVSGLWPDAPAVWSYSTLKEVETCARRYSLRRAAYVSLWDRRGYPEPPSVPALIGDIVHRSLEAIIGAFSREGCTGVDHPSAVAVLRELGGYTSIVADFIGERVDRFESNPRAAQVLAITRARLTERIPEMRERIQTIVSRVHLVNRAVSGGSNHDSSERSPLGIGSHPEAELVACDLRITGRADLVTIADGQCEIVDFKTGAADPGHAEQLRLYALLWHLDATSNPGQVPVRRLVISYVNEDIQVEPPGNDEFEELVEILRERVSTADEAVLARTPIARPSESCRWCPVRHLCEEYWASEQAIPTQGRIYADFEVLVIARNGSRSWSVVLGDDESRALLRTPSEEVSFAAGNRLRLLGIRWLGSEEDEPTILGFTRGSEAFLVVSD